MHGPIRIMKYVQFVLIWFFRGLAQNEFQLLHFITVLKNRSSKTAFKAKSLLLCMPLYSNFTILNMKYGLNVTLFVYNMQPCATARLTINSYRFCSWQQVPGEPSKYCSFTYREEQNRNVLSPCFSLVFKGVDGGFNLVPHHSSTLDSFFIRYAQSKQKATYWRIWNIRRDTKRRALLTEWPLNWMSVFESFIEQPPMFLERDKHQVLAA